MDDVRPDRPALVSRVIYDYALCEQRVEPMTWLLGGGRGATRMEVVGVRCEVELRDGTRAAAVFSAGALRSGIPAPLLRRIEHVHTALMLWGIGDPAWHARDVGKAACMLLAMMLPTDDDAFLAALGSPEAAARQLPRSTLT